ncbi:metal ABC transporter ATP-binding protein [Neomicrococcus aestuarii]|uniref:ABC transporter ATP-binding protein n=1 Tax=Neomicrococcus aestuarii TaxID=556325 RepID=A0A1L2ZKE6_9MICC|nr:metal ABC transporter ATP-binding protein [Neomicrococcus aestuarii]APF39843.1 ABC transporter ATP-binding protein [Neomicrococcus aestuarii]
MPSSNSEPAGQIQAAEKRQPAIELQDACLSFGERTLWDNLSFSVMPGEFVAVLGPNGCGKTTLLRVLLGLQELDRGTVRVAGQSARRGNREVGYIPQQKMLPENTPLRGRDLVALGVQGHRWGPGLPSRKTKSRVNELISRVKAESFADRPVGLLSGGEQQRLRAVQAVAGKPRVLLCDEPLLSLDLNHQRAVSSLIHQQTVDQDSAVLFVTHEINPVLPFVDKVLFLAGGRFNMGHPDEVLTSEVLSDLYGSHIDVLRSKNRVAIVGLPDGIAHNHQEGTF